MGYAIIFFIIILCVIIIILAIRGIQIINECSKDIEDFSEEMNSLENPEKITHKNFTRK